MLISGDGILHIGLNDSSSMNKVTDKSRVLKKAPEFPEPYVSFFDDSIVLCEKLEVSLGMSTDGALLGSFLSHHDMTAVAALPDHFAVA